MVMTSLAGSLAGQRLVTYLDTETVFRLVRILMLLAGLNLLYRNLW
ncbi:hypothetical protein [Aliamphritea spongicola]|nr:hypothetical protein [Aliamphritea spongicola]